MQGTVLLDRADLRLVAEQANMWPTSGLPIQLKNVQARIPNIEENSVLGIQGETTAKGEAYLALMAHSPLGEMLDGIFDQASTDDRKSVGYGQGVSVLVALGGIRSIKKKTN